MPQTQYLDPQLGSLLDSLRQRVRRYVVCDALLAIAVVVLSAFWLGLALDYLPVQLGGTEMPRLARTILLLVVIALILGIAGTLLIARLRRPLPDDSLALLVERHHPQLGGRLVTAVQLNQPGRVGDSHAPAMLRRVHDQASAAIDQVDPNRVFRWEPLVRKGLVAGPLAVLTLGLLLISPQAFGHAAGRLTLLTDTPWPRRADLEMVGVELPTVTAKDDQPEETELILFENKSLRLPRGSNPALRIRARDEGAELPVVCTVHYRSDDGTRGQSNMRRVGRIVDGFQSFILDGPPLSGLAGSFTFSVRGLDDRLTDYRIEAVEPPAIKDMKVFVRYPDYLRGEGSGEVDWERSYEAGIRLREGSDVTLVAASSRPLGDSQVLIKTEAGNEQTVTPEYSDDRREMQLRLPDFAAATAVRVVPRDVDGISAQAPYRYFLGIILDEPPELELRLLGIGSAVTPIARIPIECRASDDYAIEELVISVASSGDSNAPGSSQPDAEQAGEQPDAEQADAEPKDKQLTASATLKLDRQGQTETVMDLRDLVAEGRLPELAIDTAINVFGEASDQYDLGSAHLTRSEVFRLQVIPAEQLLLLLERRELALRARLEQTIDETRNLRDSLDLLRRRGFESDDQALDEAERTRQQQVRRLRVQQSGLQASKTSQELSGIAASFDDLLLEMVNNRVDSIDRRERIGVGVRDPLKQIVAEPLQQLTNQILEIENSVQDPAVAAEKTAVAVEIAEDVLLRLTAVLDKMLDLESYNEILEMVRELIDDQKDLSTETIEARKKRVLELFK